MHVIMVELQIKPEHVDAFQKEIARHIKATRENEPGCLQFDLCVDKDDPRTYYFYEVYADDEALERHHNSPSLAAYFEASKEWAERRAVHTATRRSPDPA